MSRQNVGFNSSHEFLVSNHAQLVIAQNTINTITNVITPSSDGTSATVTGDLNTEGDIFVKDGKVLAYQSVLTGGDFIPTACFHAICNDNATPIIAEQRTRGGTPLKVIVRGYYKEIRGSIAMKGRSGANLCNMIEWESGSGGGSSNLGRLRIHVLGPGGVEEQVLKVSSSAVTDGRGVNITGDLTTSGSTVVSSSIPATAVSTGTAGTITYERTDANNGFMYVCTATNEWQRVATSSW